MKTVFKSILVIGSFIVAAALGIGLADALSSASTPNYLELAKKSVVRISILGNGTCSATIVNDKQALTAAHCIPSPSDFFMYLLALQQPPMYVVGSKVELIPAAVQQQVDAAVIQGNFAALHKPIGVDNFTGEVFQVEEAVLCGYPLYSPILRCDRARRVGNSFFAAVFDITVIPGQSGGAVFSLDGRLIGIIHSVNEQGQTRVASTTGVLSLAPLPQ